MDTQQRKYLNSFREVNINAGCDPLIVDICLCYIRSCFSLGLNVDFQNIHPSVHGMFEESRFQERMFNYLQLLKDHFYLSTQISQNTSHLLLWYCYKLTKKGCLILFTVEDLATLLGLSVQALNYIASENFPGYTDFEVRKSNGDKRKISAPVPKLRWIQRWILENILRDIPLSKHATAYIQGRSIRDNAAPHVGSKIVVNLDFKSFFPTITFQRILGVYLEIGYVYPVAVLLAKLCCHKTILPQGAPTSPAISNLICRRLDSRLKGLAKKLGFNYTRYADDITFSGEVQPDGLIRITQKIIEEEGFQLAKRKTRIRRCGNSQRVTGLIVNEKINIPRSYYKKIRAIIHNCKVHGIESQNRENVPNFKAQLYGHAYYIYGITPALGKRLFSQLNNLK